MTRRSLRSRAWYRVTLGLVAAVAIAGNASIVLGSFIPGPGEGARTRASLTEDIRAHAALNVLLALALVLLLVAPSAVSALARRGRRACCPELEAAMSRDRAASFLVTGRRGRRGRAEVWLTALRSEVDDEGRLRAAGRVRISHCPWCGTDLDRVRWSGNDLREHRADAELERFREQFDR
ncbi:MAG: hypothetical protein AAFZ87_19420 [Planctomycetota bacterium]